ncbi:putative hydrolase of the HAD superfamily [Kribbella sp. VKM Ac-2571]|uniref:HAD family hydrolase n=1 Tax=Kribbella sp. VKM Ac-2571 TaxID=2512222 RepID=UPI001060CD87|nr:HAD-IA family hydrolase [Kribbella sp. VKM Ac-2571]TDO54131.1 putative hydrolase of the HAD superfamily [Kribbella sp. VKM Ac-2571]
MTPSAVLFDADGVVQRPDRDWWSQLTSLVGSDGEAFVADLMAAEKPALIGKVDFRDALADVLRRWNSPASVEEALEPWSWFVAEPEVIALIQSLRSAGVGCHLATNQHAYRRAIMQDERGYGGWFDQTFYSCDVGLAKPDPAYFRAILGSLELPASSVLFIDDNVDNVAGAASVGLRAEVYDLSSGVPALVELLRRHDLPGVL